MTPTSLQSLCKVPPTQMKIKSQWSQRSYSSSGIPLAAGSAGRNTRSVTILIKRFLIIEYEAICLEQWTFDARKDRCYIGIDCWGLELYRRR